VCCALLVSLRGHGSRLGRQVAAGSPYSARGACVRRALHDRGVTAGLTYAAGKAEPGCALDGLGARAARTFVGVRANDTTVAVRFCDVKAEKARAPPCSV
jgi:hypothetical protein